MLTTTSIIKIMTDFFETTDFPISGRTALENDLLTLSKDEVFQNTLDLYLEGELAQDVFLQNITVASQRTGVNEYTVALLMLISFTDRLKEIYISKNYPADVYENSICDLKYKAEECFETKNVWGTFVAPWLYKWVVPERFAIGRLQFEIFELGYEYQDLKADTPCLKIHIPRSGKPLTPESIDSAILKAKEFFKDTFTDKKIPIVCKSWLLYDKFEGLFKEGSNTDLFRRRFDIISNTPDADNTYPDMWRLFDMDYTGNIDDYPEDTSLRISFKNYLKNGGQTGVSYGVFFV